MNADRESIARIIDPWAWNDAVMVGDAAEAWEKQRNIARAKADAILAVAEAKPDFPDMWNEAIEDGEQPQEWGEVEIPVLVSDLEKAIAALDAGVKTIRRSAEFAAFQAPRGDEVFAWLIEAPGPRYLGVREMSKMYGEFLWVSDANAALRFWSEEQADKTMLAIRRMEPSLFGFEVTLGNAWPRQHGWVS